LGLDIYFKVRFKEFHKNSENHTDAHNKDKIHDTDPDSPGKKTDKIRFQGKTGLTETEIKRENKQHEFVAGNIPWKDRLYTIIIPSENHGAVLQRKQPCKKDCRKDKHDIQGKTQPRLSVFLVQGFCKKASRTIKNQEIHKLFPNIHDNGIGTTDQYRAQQCKQPNASLRNRKIKKRIFHSFPNKGKFILQQLHVLSAPCNSCFFFHKHLLSATLSHTKTFRQHTPIVACRRKVSTVNFRIYPGFMRDAASDSAHSNKWYLPDNSPYEAHNRSGDRGTRAYFYLKW